MGTNNESPNNLQFNTVYIFFITFLFVEVLKFYGNSQNFTIFGEIVLKIKSFLKIQPLFTV